MLLAGTSNIVKSQMKSKIITVIPVRNGAKFILETLQSVAAQTLRPDRLIILDNCSTDNTEELVKGFKPIQCEWRQNETNVGPVANFNRALAFADQAEYLHHLNADDLIKPEFYERLTRELDTCEGLGMAYSLDERIDENNERLSLSGRVTGAVEIQTVADFLKEKAELANQAIPATLLKTAGQKPHCVYREDYPMLADMLFWAEWAGCCQRIVRIHEDLSQYRWHGTNGSWELALDINALILDEWRLMQHLEQLRGASPSFLRQFKLRGLFASRSGIKAKRLRQSQNFEYARKVAQVARATSGPLAWYMAQVLVEARDVLLYTLGSRRRHPKNIYG